MEGVGHGAHGLPAAIVELVSGHSYRDFLKAILFLPARMTRTGFYGSTDFIADDYAVGYGASEAGHPNIPANWGPTSWMVSTPADLHRFVTFIRGGGLSETSQQALFVDGLLRGGTDRGLFCAFSDAPGHHVLSVQQRARYAGRQGQGGGKRVG